MQLLSSPDEADTAIIGQYLCVYASGDTYTHIYQICVYASRDANTYRFDNITNPEKPDALMIPYTLGRVYRNIVLAYNGLHHSLWQQWRCLQPKEIHFTKKRGGIHRILDNRRLDKIH